jgi:hypothetical protein
MVGGPVPVRRRSGCGTILLVIFGFIALMAILSMLTFACSSVTTGGVQNPPQQTVVNPPAVTVDPTMVDARAENDFNSADHHGQNVVNVPFDDYFEDNMVFTIPNRDTPLEVCSWDVQVSAEIVGILQHALNYTTVSNAGVCGQ